MSLFGRIPLAVPHYYDFRETRPLVGDDLVNPQSWDAIRTTTGPFGLPAERQTWEQAAQHPELHARAEAIASELETLGAARVCSYGVGTGLLELSLSRAMPRLELICTDYAPQATDRLRKFFPEATVLVHDFEHEPLIDADAHLFHRVDSELDDGAWRRIFAGLEQPAVVVATELATLGLVAAELRRRLGRGGATRAGWVRTEAGLRRLWREHHVDRSFRAGALHGFILTPRSRRARS